MDNLSIAQRSYNMSRIKSKWTSQEIKVHNFLKGNKIKHKMHPELLGNPDVLIKTSNTIVLVHGCFWHCCRKHFILPKSNIKYWKKKIQNNVQRDIKNISGFQKSGMSICVIWEHDFKNDAWKKKLLGTSQGYRKSI